MWTIDSPGMTDWGAGPITPVDVLYFYDSPLLFRARIGLSDFLVYKVEERSESGLFLVVPTSERIVEAVKKGVLSLRGALDSSSYWILDVGPKFDVYQYWKVLPSDLPGDFLPEAGLGILAHKLPVADTIEQAISFFSVKFTGEEMTEKAMPFSLFKGLVENVYDAIRKIFRAPVVGSASLNRILDFEVFQPRFSSLVIAIKEPKLDLLRLKDDIRQKVHEDLVLTEAVDQRHEFFKNMSAIVDEAKRGELKKSFANEHFYTLDQVNDIVPSDTNKLDRVEFRSQGASSPQVLTVDHKLGERIRQAYRVAESSKRNTTGAVIDVNGESATLVIKDYHHRQITCVFDRDTFDRADFELGDRISVSGEFRKRKRRDKLMVDEIIKVQKKEIKRR